MEHACVQSRSYQVVGGSDGVDIPRHVQVELLHGNHLRIGKNLEVGGLLMGLVGFDRCVFLIDSNLQTR